MAEEVNIDRISIEIEAAANRAVTPLLELADAMRALRDSLSGIKGLSAIANELSKLSEINGLDIAIGIDHIASALNALKLNTSDMPNITSIADGMRLLGDSVRALQDVDISRVSQNFEELSTAVTNLENALPDIPRITALGSALSGLNPGLINAATGFAQTAKSGRSAHHSFSLFSSGLKGIKGLISPVSRMFKQLGRDIQKSAKDANIFSSNLLRAFARIALYRTIRLILSEITKAFREGITNIMQFSAETGAAMNQLATESLYLKNTMGALAAPIINVLAPAFHILTDAIVEVVNAIGMFIAALTGAGTFVKAKHAFADIAAAAGKANKEINFMIGGFDELHEIPEVSAADTGIPNIADMFEEVPITSSILDFVERIKEAFKIGDYEGIGKIIAEEINKMIERLDQWIKWENLGPKIMHGIDIVSGIINGFVAGLNWDRLGETIADGINTIAYSIIYWFDSINWDEIGVGIGTSLNSMVARIDWAAVGEAFAKNFNSSISVLGAMAATFDWAEFGRGLSTGINKFFSTFDFKGLGKGINDFGIGILTTLLETIKNVDWKQIGSNVAKMLNEINWPEFMGLVGKVIGEAFKAALDLLIGFAAEFDWAGFGEGIYDLLAGIDWLGILERIITLIGYSVVSQVDMFEPFGKRFVEDLGALLEPAMGSEGKKIADALWDGLTSAFIVFNPILIIEKLKDLVAAIKELFGIKSPSTVFFEIGLMLLQGMIDGIFSLREKVIERFQDLVKQAKDVWTGIKDWFTVNVTNPIRDAFDSMWKSIGQGLVGAANKIINAMNRLIEAAVAPINELIEAANELPFVNIPTIRIRIPSITIPSFETGGFPDRGDLFFANESGPELVGSMGGRTTVANQTQIVAGIAEGVEGANAAVVDAINGVNDTIRARPVISDSDIAQANITGSSKRGIVMSRNPAFTY